MPASSLAQSPTSAPAPSQVPVVSTARMPWAYASAFALLVVLSVAAPSNSAIGLLVVAGLLVLPGAFLARLLLPTLSSAALRLAFSVGFSAIISMLVGYAVSLIGPFLGDASPMLLPTARWILLVEALFALTICYVRGIDPLRWLAHRVSTPDMVATATSLLLPLASALAAMHLTATADNSWAVAVLVACVVVLAGSSLLAFSSARAPLAPWLFSLALALAYSTSMRGQGLFGWDIQKEFAVASSTLSQGHFALGEYPADAYESMLSLTVLPAQLSVLSALSVSVVLRLVFPLFLAFAVTTVFAAARRPYRRGVLFSLLALLCLAAPSFQGQMPAIGRQELALLLIALFFAVLMRPGLRPRTARIAAALLAVAVAFTHYSSSYILCALLVFAWLVGAVLHRSARAARTRVITWQVVLAAILATFAWNVLITGSAQEMRQQFARAGEQDVSAFARADENLSPLDKWLKGTSAQETPVATYQQALLSLQPQSFPWLTHVPGWQDVTVHDSKAPTMDGVFHAPDLATLVDVALSQAQLLACVIASVWLAWVTARRSRKVPGLGPDVAAMAVGFVLLLASLRLSPMLAAVYNPERGQLQGALLFAPVVAAWVCARPWPLALRLARALTLTAVACLALVMSTGLSAVLFSGPAPASVSSTGEDAERFVISAQDLAAAKWLSQMLDTEALVQIDRYGRLPLLDFYTITSLAPWDQLLPAVQDTNAWILATDANLDTGRARGQVGQLFSTFEFPRAFLESTRALVFSTDGARVYR